MKITRKQLRQIIKEVEGQDTGHLADLELSSFPEIPSEIGSSGDLETPGWYTELVEAIDSLGANDEKIAKKINKMLEKLRTIPEDNNPVARTANESASRQFNRNIRIDERGNDSDEGDADVYAADATGQALGVSKSQELTIDDASIKSLKAQRQQALDKGDSVTANALGLQIQTMTSSKDKVAMSEAKAAREIDRIIKEELSRSIFGDPQDYNFNRAKRSINESGGQLTKMSRSRWQYLAGVKEEE
jgi:hypothetical protein